MCCYRVSVHISHCVLMPVILGCEQMFEINNITHPFWGGFCLQKDGSPVGKSAQDQSSEQRRMTIIKSF